MLGISQEVLACSLLAEQNMCMNIQAVEIDGEHAVLVRDKSSGQVRLVTEKQLFIPGPNESIESLVCKTDV